MKTINREERQGREDLKALLCDLGVLGGKTF
jgi:hypothetical protein